MREHGDHFGEAGGVVAEEVGAGEVEVGWEDGAWHEGCGHSGGCGGVIKEERLVFVFNF